MNAVKSISTYAIEEDFLSSHPGSDNKRMYLYHKDRDLHTIRVAYASWNNKNRPTIKLSMRGNLRRSLSMFINISEDSISNYRN